MKRNYNTVLQECINEVQKLQKKYTPKNVYKMLDDIGTSVIMEWYGSYHRHFYDIQGSLYHAYKITVTKDIYKVDFDASFLSDFEHHQSNEIVFNNAFMHGYHGGSRGMSDSNDKIGWAIPLWRGPVPTFQHWAAPAVRTFSPYEVMCKKMTQKMNRINKELERKEAELIRKLSPYFK